MNAPHPRARRVTLPVGLPRATGWFDPAPSSVPTVGELLGQVEEAAGDVILGGGEPLSRPDLPELLGALAPWVSRLWLRTGGGSLRHPSVLALLRRHRVRVRVSLFAARAPASSYLSGSSGRHALLGLRAAADAGLAVWAELVLTRPGLAELEELTELALSLGARGVAFVLPPVESLPPDRAVALGARVGLCSAALAGACAAVLRAGVGLEAVGIPRCMLPRGARGALVSGEPGAARCGGCEPGCDGLGAGYAQRFGVAELRTSPTGPVPVTRMALLGPDGGSGPLGEPTRGARMRLLRALEERPERLWFDGPAAFEHPECAELLREAVRGGPRVEIAGDLSPLHRWDEDTLHRVRKLARADAAILGPDPATHDARVGRSGAFEDTLQVLERLAHKRIEVGAFAVLGPEPASAYEGLWETLPGPPQVRLGPEGSMSALLAELPSLSPALRGAVERVLPSCRIAGEKAPPARWSADGPWLQGIAPDPLGRFGPWTPCGCGDDACPGTPPGWDDAAVAP